jgi:hypothetical protein
MEEVNTGESWNKKRVIIAGFLILLLIVGGYFFKTRFLNANLSQRVKGTSTQEEASVSVPRINVQEAVKEKIDNLKQEVSGLDVMEIATSSPQVQKILNDVKALQQYPTNQIQAICKKICGL